MVEVIKPIVEYEKKAKIAFQIPYGEADLYFTVSYSRSGARWTATVTDPQGSRTPPAGTADTGA